MALGLRYESLMIRRTCLDPAEGEFGVSVKAISTGRLIEEEHRIAVEW